MKILSYSYNDGAQWWRFGAPFKWLNEKYGYRAYATNRNIQEYDIAQADVVCLKSVVDQLAISTVLANRFVNGTKLLVDVDDALFTDESNPYFKKWDVTDASFTITQTIKAADVVTTTTEYLADQLKHLNKNVVVIPNSIEPEWFKVKGQKNESEYVRIGWAGSITHIKDLEMISPVLNAILRKNENVKLVMCGDTRLTDLIRDKSRLELFDPVPIEVYPMRLASMQMDIGICPLVDSEFNRCKSPIKALEQAWLGIPSVCSPTVYSTLPFVEIANNDSEWIEKLQALIDSSKKRERMGEKAQEYVHKTYNLEKNVELWHKTFEALKVSIDNA